MATNIVGLTCFALMIDQINRLGMVNNPEPVADILAFAINRKRFIVEDIVNEKRNELLRN